MKNFKSLGWVVLSALLVFSSCKDDDDDDPQPKPEPREVEYSVTLGGDEFAIPDSNAIDARYRSETTIFSSSVKDNTIEVTMIDQDQDVITITAHKPYEVTNDDPTIEEKNYTVEGNNCIDVGSNASLCERFSFSYLRTASNGTTTIFSSNSNAAYGSMEVTEFDTNNNRVSAVFEAMAYTSDESDSIRFEGEVTYIRYTE